MSKELKLQTDIIKSVERMGGYGLKMSNRFMIGIPDLLIMLPPYAPCIIEVKDFGEVVDKFNLKVPVTPKQNHTLNLMSGVYERHFNHGCVSMVLVGMVHKNEHRLVSLHRDEKQLDYTYEQNKMWVKRETGLHYNLFPLLRAQNIAGIML